jgi:hypothetical protein
MKTVLKKAGIVVATAAAGLLAVSPLAFAGDYSGGGGDHHGDHHSSHHHKKKVSCKLDNSVDNGHKNSQRGLVNVQNTNVSVPIQACDNSVIEGVLGILAKGQRNSDSHR